MEDDYSDRLAGSVEQAWARSLDVWRQRGRVEDFPKGERRPRYSPDFGKRLGEAFAERFAGDHAFVSSKLSSLDPIESACAYDVLELIFKVWLRRRRLADTIIQADFEELKLALPPRIKKEIESDRIYEDFQGTTIGEFFRFMDRIGEY